MMRFYVNKYGLYTATTSILTWREITFEEYKNRTAYPVKKPPTPTPRPRPVK